MRYKVSPYEPPTRKLFFLKIYHPVSKLHINANLRSLAPIVPSTQPPYTIHPPAQQPT